MSIINTRKDKWIFFVLILFVFGCQKHSLNKAKQYSILADIYYRKAVKVYKDLILKGRGDDSIYFNLGKLYFEHADFGLAIETLKKSNLSEAKKYIAISYYKTNDYTEALKIFDNLGALEDDFYLYHYGLNCEALNLYEQARLIYQRIKNPPYKNLARKNLDKIEQIFKQDISLEDKEMERFFDKRFSKEFYPEASALFLLVDEEYEVAADKSAVYSGHFIIKILDERGKEDFSEVIIGYDSTYEKPHLEFARTIKEDRTSVPVGKKHIRDVSRYLNFPLYSNARALIVSMPEVSPGCIIEYKIKISKNQLIDKKHFSFSYFLQEAEPIVEANFSVVLPSIMTLNIKTLNEKYNQFGAELSPTILKEENKIKYLWRFQDIPQIISESFMPSNVEVNPTIILSTLSKWQQVYDWWWRLSKDKLKATKPIKEAVYKLTKDAKNPEEKARSLYNFCTRYIRYVAVAYGQAGYEPHTAEEIFLNKYGDCKDQSILLVTMLREAGLKAYPVLIGSRDYFNLSPDYPSVLFNHCIVLVELEGKTIFLDPTSTTCSFGDLPVDDQERKVLVFKDDGFQIMDTPVFSAQHNNILHSFKVNLDSEGMITAEKKIIPGGFYNQVQRAWLLYSQPEMIRQSIEEGIQDISVGAKLNSYKIENLEDWDKPVILKYDFKGPFY
ncbi:MAG: DUF3857 domain-containing protein, partial [Candidatus Omnitrophica bacterium]|nr:DUF3857 domain-containing protein [Candidatus Omnitrophota bacterium]